MTNKKKPERDSFDLLDVIQRREEAIKRSADNTNTEWRDAALELLYMVALEKQTLTVDDLREKLLDAEIANPDFPQTYNRSALGPVMRAAANRGWISGTGTTTPARNALAHSRPHRVWRSLIANGNGAKND